MPDDLIAKWPQVRLNPELRDQLEKLLARANDRSSLTKVVNDLVSEALESIEARRPKPLATVLRFRRATGQPDEEDDDLVSRVLRVEEMVIRLAKATGDYDDALSKAPREKKQAARKRAA